MYSLRLVIGNISTASLCLCTETRVLYADLIFVNITLISAAWMLFTVMPTKHSKQLVT